MLWYLTLLTFDNTNLDFVGVWVGLNANFGVGQVTDAFDGFAACANEQTTHVRWDVKLK